MNYPKIIVDMEKLSSNLDFMSSKMKENNLSFIAVTKVFSAHPEIVKLYDSKPYISYLADSRISNIINYGETKKESLLLRIPMQSEVEDVVKHANVSFNSEVETIKLLNKAAAKLNIVHKIVLMVDLGDLREGFFDENELYNAIAVIKGLSNIQIIGLATNLTCYGAVIPTKETLQKLVEYGAKIKETFGIELEIISGGNSSSLHLLDIGLMPEGINNLRIGEAIVLGRETAYEQDITGMYQDVFTLEVELVELKKKPSYPIGEMGVDAFGNKPDIKDVGEMRRGIVAIGKQDTVVDSLVPRDSRIKVIGASSDHLILDMSKVKDEYNIGDVVQFDVGYGALLAAFTSKYVYKKFINKK